MNILVVQNRMGMGDLVIFMPFIEAISKKYKVPITCLVKKNSKANEIFKDNEFIKEFIFLERGNGEGDHDGITGSIILLGVGGSGPTKRVPAKIFLETMNLIQKNYDTKFYLATGKNFEEQEILNEILNSNLKDKCVPLDNLMIPEILPIIKNCKISICNDSSFSHLSAALGLPTIVLMTDTPLVYGSYSPKMYPIIPDGEKTVTHNTLGKDKINPRKIFLKLKEIIN